MKRIFLFFTIAAVSAFISLSAQNAPISSIAEVNTNDNTVIVPVTVENFAGIASANLKLIFDNSAVSLTNITLGPGVGGTFSFDVLNDQISIGWARGSEITLTNHAVFFTMVFQRLEPLNTAEILWDNSSQYSCMWFSLSTLLIDMPYEEYYTDGLIAPLATTTVHLFLEGLYNTSTNQMNKTHDFDGSNIFPKFTGTIVDLITVELRDPVTFNTIVYQVNDVPLHQNGTAVFASEEPLTGDYYITIKTRNHLKTVSAMPVSFENKNITYDFRLAATQAYDTKMKELSPGVWGLYAGDINQDGIIDVTDRSIVQSELLKISRGYMDEDINGDGIIDVSDRSVVQSGVLQIIQTSVPSEKIINK